ncbi:MAG: energy-coupling factor transporter transmembrane component T family protein [Candidatus Hodarchaeales archaeon]
MTDIHHHYSALQTQKQVLDIRSKLIGLVLIVLGCSFLVDFSQVSWYTILLLLLVLILKPRKTILKQIVLTLPLIISLSLISFFSFDPPTYTNFLFEATHNKVSFALFTAFRSIVIISYILVIVNSEESFFEIIYGLDDLKLPGLLTNLLFLTYRFFSLIQEEFSRILDARSNRMYSESSIMQLRSLKLIGNILGASLARSFKRAEYISASLSARGFSGTSKFSHPEKPWTRSGFLFVIFTINISIFIGFYGQNSPIDLLLGLLFR